MNPVIAATFYKDISRPAQKGDEFIELAWEHIAGGFELRIIRGKFQEESSHKEKRYVLTSKSDLDDALQKYTDEALRKGFRRVV